MGFVDKNQEQTEIISYYLPDNFILFARLQTGHFLVLFSNHFIETKKTICQGRDDGEPIETP